MNPSVLLLCLLLSVAFFADHSDACSRATWLGKDGTAITGRSMDWPYDFNTHFCVIPRGEKNEGLPVNGVSPGSVPHIHIFCGFIADEVLQTNGAR